MYGYGMDQSCYGGYGSYGGYGGYGGYGTSYGSYSSPRRSIFDNTLLNAGGVAVGGAIANGVSGGAISRGVNSITTSGCGKAAIYGTAALAGGWLVKQFFGSGS